MADSQRAQEGCSLQKLHRDFQDLQEHFHALLRALSVHDPALHAKVCNEKFEAVRKQFPPGAQCGSVQSPLLELLKKPAHFTSMNNHETLKEMKQASRSCKERIGQRLFVFGGNPGLFNQNTLASVECLDFQKGAWVPVLPAMRFARTGAVAATLGESIFICGGQGHLGNLVDKYVPKLGRWDFKVPTMSCHRFWAAGATLMGKLYICGGNAFEEDSVHRSIECFNPSLSDGKGEWHLQGEMLEPRRSLAAAVLGTDRLLVCGGDSVPMGRILTAHQPLNSAESISGAYSVALPSMQMRRSFAAAASLKGAVYVCGGETDWVGHQIVERFNPGAGSWTAVAQMLKRRCCAAAVATADSLFVLGGADKSLPPGTTSAGTASVERYDPELDRWEHVATMLQGRVNFACSSL